MATKSTSELINQLGNPKARQAAFEDRWMRLWVIPDDIKAVIPCLPSKIYLNRIIMELLEKTFRELIAKNLHKEIVSFDGCFNVRYMRGTEETTRVLSRHSWGLAIDLNAAQNPLYGPVRWSREFLQVWRDNKWTCGADWVSRPDGMHFEYNDFDVQKFIEPPTV